MKATKTILVDLRSDKSTDPRYAVCYAKGRTFKLEGHELRVEAGKRALVHRTLCAARYYGDRCTVCPNAQGQLRLKAGGPTST